MYTIIISKRSLFRNTSVFFITFYTVNINVNVYIFKK